MSFCKESIEPQANILAHMSCGPILRLRAPREPCTGRGSRDPDIDFADVKFRFSLSFDDSFNYVLPCIKFSTLLFQLGLDGRLKPFLEEPYQLRFSREALAVSNFDRIDWRCSKCDFQSRSSSNAKSFLPFSSYSEIRPAVPKVFDCLGFQEEPRCRLAALRHRRERYATEKTLGNCLLWSFLELIALPGEQKKLLYSLYRIPKLKFLGSEVALAKLIKKKVGEKSLIR